MAPKDASGNHKTRDYLIGSFVRGKIISQLRRMNCFVDQTHCVIRDYSNTVSGGFIGLWEFYQYSSLVYFVPPRPEALSASSQPQTQVINNPRPVLYL